MAGRDRTLLAIRTIEVTYRSALVHAPDDGPAAHEWLGRARQKADQLLNALESQLLQRGPLDSEVALQFRIVRESIRSADARARGAISPEERPENRAG